MKPNRSKPKTALVVAHTHWDREWRYPLWKNRTLLVQVMDQLLDTLENDPSYANFLFDGQVVGIEDYLEVRPENEERIRKQVEAGRLSIGPWFTLPDLYPLDGECLVRNLLKGIRVSTRLGGHLGVGYNSFGWGQTAQFPQIYRQFGFEFLVAAKRVSKRRAPHCEFLWEAPDGSRILTTRLGVQARANLYFHGYIPVRHGMQYEDDERYAFRWEGAGPTMHDASPDRAHEDYFQLDSPAGLHPEQLPDGFQRAWDAMDETLAPDTRLVMCGSDFTDCQPHLPEMLSLANETFEDIDWLHVSLEEAAEQTSAALDQDALPVVRGEMRDGPASHCSANALAVRMYLKLRNKHVENTLLRCTEPLAALLAIHGCEHPTKLMDIAWDHLLKAHPHDSINGVTQDDTADDTLDRLRQAQQIGDALREQSIAHIVRLLDLSGYAKDDILLLLVNPRPGEHRTVLETTIDTPRGNAIWDFHLEDPNGHPLSVQHVSREEGSCPVNDLTSRPWPFRFDRHRVLIDTGNIPACGYTVLRLVPTETHNRLAEWWPHMPVSDGTELSQAPDRMENEHLAVTIRADGTIDVLDKCSGRTFPGLHRFEDSGDTGDYWARYEPYQQETHLSTASSVRIWREENGPLRTTFGIEITMHLPARADRPVAGIRGKNQRSEETRDLAITSMLSLQRGARRIDIRTTIDNTIEDHRLRLLLPTGIEADASHAGGHFHVDRRPIDPVRMEDDTFHPEMQTHPTQKFVSLDDGTSGLAVLHSCFTEFEVLRDEQRTLALTLFRSVRNLICSEFRSTGAFPNQDGGQSLRSMDYDYAIQFHDCSWDQAGIPRSAEDFNTPDPVYQITPHSRGDWPVNRSFLKLEGETLQIAAIKRACDRDSLIVRLFNSTTHSTQARLTVPPTCRAAWQTDLNEERLTSIDVDNDHRLTLPVAAGRIVTIELSHSDH